MCNLTKLMNFTSADSLYKQAHNIQKMAGVEVDKDYRCSYCFDIIGSLNDPRVLPCTHIGCRKCLEADMFYSKQSARGKTAGLKHGK